MALKETIEAGIKDAMRAKDADRLRALRAIKSMILLEETSGSNADGLSADAEMKILMKAASEDRVKAVLDVFQSKLVKRGISLKSFVDGKPYPSGKEYRIEGELKNGIDQEQAKKISKIIREEGPKSVKSQIQGDELRVQSKSRDDLQAVMALLRGSDLDIDIQFTNFR